MVLEPLEELKLYLDKENGTPIIITGYVSF